MKYIYTVTETYPDEKVGNFLSEKDLRVEDIILYRKDRYIIRSLFYDVSNDTTVLICDNLSEFERQEAEVFERMKQRESEKQKTRKWWQIF